MKKYIFLIATIICGILVLSLWYVSPMLKPFPIPTGPCAVGTTRMELYDISRKEIYSDNPDATRNLVVKLFYPARESFQEKQNYLYEKIEPFASLVSQRYAIPQWLTKRMFTIKTNAFVNAPLVENNMRYPVILFSHGLLGMPSDMYTVLLENLASNGFIVLAIDHPYFNLLTYYSDGTIVSSVALQTQFQQMNTEEQKNFQIKAIDVYKADIQFILDTLIQLDEDQTSILYHHLNLNAIGVMGHSAGGTAAIELCRIDHRLKACIDLDGWYDHIIGDTPIEQPLLLIFGSKSIEVTEPTVEYLKRKQLSRDKYYTREKKIAEHRRALCNGSTCDMIIIDGASHEDFGDEVLLKWPLRGWAAPDEYWVIQAVNNYCLQFFEKYLNHK
jgi:hypothetical protein